MLMLHYVNLWFITNAFQCSLTYSCVYVCVNAGVRSCQSAMYGMMHHYILKATSLSTKNFTCINIYTSTASSTCTLKYGNSITTTMYDNADYLFRYKLCIPNQSHPYWNQSTNCTVFILWDTWHAFECICWCIFLRTCHKKIICC